ncbi:hypothetical protein [Flavobacterium sp.]|uniref:hypothetical protein n=1 Tax=Flavobacterium sp. TaxID=239 RepID=UPI00286E445C|nr:hypothetical protein [Flavobacterium sp.]
MKKLVFTAIAMIAFSGASVASTGKVKKVYKRSPCDAGWIQAYENAGGCAAGWAAGDAWGASHNC